MTGQNGGWMWMKLVASIAILKVILSVAPLAVNFGNITCIFTDSKKNRKQIGESKFVCLMMIQKIKGMRMGLCLYNIWAIFSNIYSCWTIFHAFYLERW